MSSVTVSAIKADVGGYVGHCAAHPELIEEADRRVADAVAQELLIDGRVGACGDDVNLVMTHRHGVDAEPVQHFAWDTFMVLTEIAKRLHLYGAGQDLGRHILGQRPRRGPRGRRDGDPRAAV